MLKPSVVSPINPDSNHSLTVDRKIKSFQQLPTRDIPKHNKHVNLSKAPKPSHTKNLTISKLNKLKKIPQVLHKSASSKKPLPKQVGLSRTREDFKSLRVKKPENSLSVSKMSPSRYKEKACKTTTDEQVDRKRRSKKRSRNKSGVI